MTIQEFLNVFVLNCYDIIPEDARSCLKNLLFSPLSVKSLALICFIIISKC